MAQMFKEPEHSHLVRFASVYGFSAESLDFAPPARVPDLIVHTSQGDLGIEHTQLFKVEAGGGINTPQAQEALRNKLMWRARQIAEARGLPMLSVYAHFSHYKPLGLRGIEDAARRIVEVIATNLRLPPNAPGDTTHPYHLESWEYERVFPGLFPVEIDLLVFGVVKRPGRVIWGVPDGGAIPHITADYIQSKIDDKEPKLERYRRHCQEVWLLLAADNLALSSYFNITEETGSHTFCSRFDRVFYFESFDEKIVELKIMSSAMLLSGDAELANDTV